MKHTLTIAGSDPGGGAGVQADIKTMHAFGVYATSVVTAVTVQNTREVRDVIALPAELVRAQCDVVFDDFPISAVKTGVLASAEVVLAVAEVIAARGIQRLVVDPVMGSSDGFVLLEDDAVDAMRTSLLPLARVVTPNVPEAERLAGMKIGSLEDMKRAAAKIAGAGVEAVVITGGHADFAPGIDVLYQGEATRELRPSESVPSAGVHGTGCAFSAAVAAGLALGRPVDAAVEEAKRYVATLIATSIAPGGGKRVGDHFYAARARETGPAQ